MRAKHWFCAVGLTLLFAAVPAGAHHGFSSEYDIDKPVKVTGVVSKIEWLNPHARFYLDVADDDGTVTTWNFELASVNSLRRNGWTRTTLEVGDKVTVEGYGAHADVPMANAGAVTLPDGSALFAATSAPSIKQTPSAVR